MIQLFEILNKNKIVTIEKKILHMKQIMGKINNTILNEATL